jgi:hypothetical protein
MLEDGTTVGPPLKIGRIPGGTAEYPNVAWSGKEFGIVTRRQTPQQPIHASFVRVGCNCADGDGDLFTTCAGGDCDDSNPLINPPQPESCLDGADNNCDGEADCQDTTVCPPSSGSVPGGVSGLVFEADKETLSWQAELDSDVYDLLSGGVAELREDGDFSRSNCLVWRHPDTSYTDSEMPLPGGRYYLVRGKADQCKLGTWGSVLRDEATLTCP